MGVSVQWAPSAITPRVMYLQYSGGISSVQWRDIVSTVEGYDQYGGGYSVQKRETRCPVALCLGYEVILERGLMRQNPSLDFV